MNATPLANELFLVAHDPYSGRAHAGPKVVDTGLAGAVLGELVLSGRLLIADDSRIYLPDARPSGEPVTDAAIVRVAEQVAPHPAQAWVEYLRDHTRDAVVTRMLRAGIIQQPRPRGMLRNSMLYPAADPLSATSALLRLRHLLDHPGYLDDTSAALGGLVLATKLDFLLTGGSPNEVRDGLARMYQRLPAGLRVLVAAVESAVAGLTAGASA
jgi:hypothetical protein